MAIQKSRFLNYKLFYNQYIKNNVKYKNFQSYLLFKKISKNYARAHIYSFFIYYIRIIYTLFYDIPIKRYLREKCRNKVKCNKI